MTWLDLTWLDLTDLTWLDLTWDLTTCRYTDARAEGQRSSQDQISLLLFAPCVYRYIRSFNPYLRICVCKKKSAQLGTKKIKMPVIQRCGGWYHTTSAAVAVDCCFCCQNIPYPIMRGLSTVRLPLSPAAFLLLSAVRIPEWGCQQPQLYPYIRKKIILRICVYAYCVWWWWVTSKLAVRRRQLLGTITVLPYAFCGVKTNDLSADLSTGRFRRVVFLFVCRFLKCAFCRRQ